MSASWRPIVPHRDSSLAVTVDARPRESLSPERRRIEAKLREVHRTEFRSAEASVRQIGRSRSASSGGGVTPISLGVGHLARWAEHETNSGTSVWNLGLRGAQFVPRSVLGNARSGRIRIGRRRAAEGTLPPDCAQRSKHAGPGARLCARTERRLLYGSAARVGSSQRPGTSASTAGIRPSDDS